MPPDPQKWLRVVLEAIQVTMCFLAAIVVEQVCRARSPPCCPWLLCQSCLSPCIGAFCTEMYFTEEHFELQSTTEATVGPTKAIEAQTWCISCRIWSGKGRLSSMLAVAVTVELPQPYKGDRKQVKNQDRHTKGDCNYDNLLQCQNKHLSLVSRLHPSFDVLLQPKIW